MSLRPSRDGYYRRLTEEERERRRADQRATYRRYVEQGISAGAARWPTCASLARRCARSAG